MAKGCPSRVDTMKSNYYFWLVCDWPETFCQLVFPHEYAKSKTFSRCPR